LAPKLNAAGLLDLLILLLHKSILNQQAWKQITPSTGSPGLADSDKANDSFPSDLEIK
jgi:hypothetical protein